MDKAKSKDAVRIGVIGCGNISAIYLKNLGIFRNTKVISVADLDMGRARARAKEFNIPAVCTVKQMLADPDVEVVLNITIPKAHYQVSMAALNAGKHLYSEKPLAIVRKDGEKILKTALARKLLLGCAPDTFMGAGLQTCRKVIEDGVIGQPIGAAAFMMYHGAESWHPDPEFLYETGGGPILDMGGYYLNAFISLIGPVKAVHASHRATFPERLITSLPKRGKRLKVEVSTHVAAVLEFQTGAIATLVASFDVWAHTMPNIQIYGTEGSMTCPDPNTFGGPVLVQRSTDKKWKEVRLKHSYAENSRGLGLADMARSLRTGRPYRATGLMAYHALETMTSILDSGDLGKSIPIRSTCARPKPLPIGLKKGEID